MAHSPSSCPDIQTSFEGTCKVDTSRLEDLDLYNPVKPPPLDWKSDSSRDLSEKDVQNPGFPCAGDHVAMFRPAEAGLAGNVPVDFNMKHALTDTGPVLDTNVGERWDIEYSLEEPQECPTFDKIKSKDVLVNRMTSDEGDFQIQTLLSHLHLMASEPHPSLTISTQHLDQCQQDVCSYSLYPDNSCETTGLLFSVNHQRNLMGVLASTEIGSTPQAAYLPHRGEMDAELETECPDPLWLKLGEEPPREKAAQQSEQIPDEQPSYQNVPGPCDPEDLLDGVVFGAKYLGSTQIKSDRNPSTNARMLQAQEAVDRIKAPVGESQPMTEVDLFISTQRIKVLSADSQEAMMDHVLQTISYIADIGNVVVLMARRNMKGQNVGSSSCSGPQKNCFMICHVFCSEDAQTIAQAIGQAFGVAYQQFLQTNGVKACDLKPGEYGNPPDSQELYNGDLAHFSDSQNLRDVVITKAAGEIMGLAIVESGWGSILPTVVVANLLHGGPAERCGELSIGDRIMSINGTSMVGLSITACTNIIKDLKSEKYVNMSIVRCPPVTMAVIRRPDFKFQLGFSVENGIICSLMRGGIAERGGIRVGHRIIEINGQSVVATPHEKIIQILTNASGEIRLKTMPTSTYRLLTGQEQPVFL